MNKKTLRIAGWALGLSMAVAGIGVAVGASLVTSSAHVAAMDSGEFAKYTKLTTANLSTLSTSKKVVLAQSNGSSGVTGFSGSDATVAADGWLEFTVTDVNTTNGTYSLKNSSTNKWISLLASNAFSISSASQTDLVADANGYVKYVDSSSNTRYLCKNGTYYRCYKSIGSYTPFYAYIVPEASPLDHISISGSYKTSFENGESFSHDGITVTAHYEDSSTKDVTASAEFSGYDTSVAGNQTVTVTYTENEVSKTATYDITVADAKLIEVSSVSISGIEDESVLDGASDDSIFIGATIDLTGTVNYTQGSEYQDGTGALTWTSSDSTVASVEDGVVTLFKNGADVTITATSAENGEKSASVTFSIQNIQEKPGTEARPFTVAEAKAAITWDTNTSSVEEYYAVGYVKKVVNGNTNHTYYLVDDPDDTTTPDSDCLQAYSRSAPEGFSESAAGDKVIVKGVLTYYGGKKEIGSSTSGFTIIDVDEETLSLDLSLDEDTVVLNSDFSYSGTITANYKHKSDVPYDPDDERFTITGFDTTSVGDKTVTVAYDDDVFEAIEETYTLHVVYGDLSSFTLSSSGKSVGFDDDSVDLDDIDVTVNENANPNYTWSLFSAKDTSDVDMVADTDYIYDAVEHTLLTGEKAGTIVFKATSAADPSFFALYTVTVTGDPIVRLSATSVTGVSGKTTTVSVSGTENLTAPLTYSWSVVSGEESVTSVTSGEATSTLSLGSVGSASVKVRVTDKDSKYAEAVATVDVIENLNDILAGDSPFSTLEFEAQCKGSGTANDGAVWAVTSDGVESNFDSTHGIHYGTNSASVTYLQLATSDITSKVTSVTVRCRDAQAKATVSVSVGGVAFVCDGSAKATNESSNYTFTGIGKGEIIVRVDRGSSMTKAIYVKSIIVGGPDDNIANMNPDVQQAALEFVDGFNSTMNCEGVNGNTENVASKWGTAESLFNTWRTASGDADAYNDLFKYADSVEGGDSLQDMLARYDYIIKKYNSAPYNLGLKDFLNADGGAGRAAVKLGAFTGGSPLLQENRNDLALPLIVTVVAMSILAIGALGWARRRREED